MKGTDRVWGRKSRAIGSLNRVVVILLRLFSGSSSMELRLMNRQKEFFWLMMQFIQIKKCLSILTSSIP